MAATFPTSPTNGQTAVVGGVSFVYNSTAGVWNQLLSGSSTPTLTSPTINTSVSGTAIKDEDNMLSDSATALATQQSIKAYVDTSISSFSTTLSGLTDTTISTPSSGQVLKYNGSAWINDTDAGGISSLVQDTSPQLGANLDVNGFAISWGDNEKARFGNADDFQIYHDGSNSYLSEQGTGNLIIQGSNSIKFQNSAGTSEYAWFGINDASRLYYAGSQKLTTASTGVSVTGTLTATAFSGDGSSITNINNIKSATSDPTGTSAGDIYYNSTDKVLKTYDGTAWTNVNEAVFSASGGTETTYAGYKVHTFTSSGTFTVSSGETTVDYLIVAGGGGGGKNAGGGGGAGGMITGTASVSSGSYTITVGGGGAGGTTSSTDTLATQGSNSSAFSQTAIGGGAGTNSGGVGGSGGSGGGAGNYGSGNKSGGSGTSGQGNAGGDGTIAGGASRTGGGGGGKGAAGQASQSASQAGAGGNGATNTYRTGSAVTYAGGGGGACHSGSGGAGGSGGGGRGGNDVTATAGSTNTGGGGGADQPGDGKAGGSGIVVIRYAV